MFGSLLHNKQKFENVEVAEDDYLILEIGNYDKEWCLFTPEKSTDQDSSKICPICLSKS